jgi:anthranilate phosphoribosyltransferase
VRAVLEQKRHDEARKLVVMTAAAALVLGGVANDLRDGARRAGEAIDSGAALGKLDLLIKSTNETA